MVAITHRRPRALLVAAAVSLVMGGVAEARPSLLLSGTSALDRARAAWAQADFEVAESAYAEAVTRGALGRTELIESYAYLGASRSIVGNKEGALVAFRLAASVDPAFEVPAEAGKKAAALADTARKHATALKLEATAPEHVASGAPFAVTTLIEPSQLALIARVGLLVRDRSGAVIYRFEDAPGAAVTFRVPGAMVNPGGDLSVRVDALDTHDNQLAVSEVRVTVSAAPVAAMGPESARVTGAVGGGFWHTPWPWVIGGALAAVGGAGVYLVLRAPSEVNLGAARVQAN